jgi:hypothetical protein
MIGSNPAKGHYETPDCPNAKRLTSNIKLSFDGCRVCPSVQANALTKTLLKSQFIKTNSLVAHSMGRIKGRLSIHLLPRFICLKFTLRRSYVRDSTEGSSFRKTNNHVYINIQRKSHHAHRRVRS